MPTYRIETNQGTFDIEANREPTPDEISQYIGSQKSTPAPADPTSTSNAPAPVSGVGNPYYINPQAVKQSMQKVAAAVFAPKPVAPSPDLAAQLARFQSNPRNVDANGNIQRDPNISALQQFARGLDFVGKNFSHYYSRPDVEAKRIAEAKGLASLAVRGALPAAGQAVGMASKLPVLGGIVGGALGGAAGTVVDSAMSNETPKMGDVLGSAIAGSVPGSSLAGASKTRITGEALKNVAANITAKAAQTYMDEKRMPTPEEIALAGGSALAGTALAKALDQGLNPTTVEAAVREAQDVTRRQTLQAGKELGYVLPPSIVRPNLGNDSLGSVAGKAATAQEAVRRNQPITNAAIREELGLQPAQLDKGGTGAISIPELNTAKMGPNGAYAAVAGLSPQAKIRLEEFKLAQSNANNAYASLRNNYDVAVKNQAEQFQKDADASFKALEAEAKQAGKPELIDDLRAARVKLAKIALVENAINKGTGDVDVTVIGKAYDAGEKLSGNLEKIGRFQNAFSKLVKDMSDSPPSGVHQLLPVAGAGFGGMILTSGHGLPAAGTALGATMAGPMVARNVVLSRPYQNAFVNYNYGATRQDMPAMVARFAAQSAGRNAPPLILQPQPQASR